MAHHRLWQFRPPAGGEKAFAEAYASGGPWAEVFGQAPGFIGTRLMRPPEGSDWWLTIDSWDSAEAFANFLENHREAYAALDRQLEGIAGEETFIGAFDDA